MKVKINVKMIGVLLMAVFILSTITIAGAMAGTVYVDVDNEGGTEDGTTLATAYGTITEGLANAIAGDTVLVADGTYVDTGGEEGQFPLAMGAKVGLTLISTDGAATTIITMLATGSPDGIVVQVSADDQTIEGFTINGLSGSVIYISPGLSGVNITDNVIVGDADTTGISMLDGTDGATISGNNISDGTTNIQIFAGATGNLITGNILQDSLYDGISFEGGLTGSRTEFNNITNNIINGSGTVGIGIWEEGTDEDFFDDNRITDNYIYANTEDGIYVETTVQFLRLVISGNNISDNGQSGIDIAAGVIISNVNITDNDITLNTEDGITTLSSNDDDASPSVSELRIRNNRITGNTLLGMDYQTGADWINATMNWWGVNTASLVADELVGEALIYYAPWLGSADGSIQTATANYTGAVTSDGNLTVVDIDLFIEVEGGADLWMSIQANTTGVAATTSTYSSVTEYIDIQVTSGTADELYITVDYVEATIEALGLTEDQMVLYWWSDVVSLWQPVSPSGVNETANFVWARLSSTSSPTIAELTGTAFGPGDAVDKGDTLDVSGTGVTAGSTVNVYWDAVTGSDAVLLNTTEANSDGTWDLEIDVPSDVAGLHFIWVNGDDISPAYMYSEVLMVQKISVSPSSGLIGDDIVVTGYGFAPSDDIVLTWNLTATGSAVLVTRPTTITTTSAGYFTATIDMPTTGYALHNITAVDEAGYTDTVGITHGASISLSPDEGPTGTIVRVTGVGWTATETITFNMGSTTVRVVGAATVTVDADGEFSADVVIPNMGAVNDYELNATESGGGAKGPADRDFDILGIPEIVVSPIYGAPGATITVTGTNFTQIAGTDVDINLDSAPARDLIIVDTLADGSFVTTFTSPAITFTAYNVSATDAYNLDALDGFQVGLVALILNPTSGEAGTAIALTGVGFTAGQYNLTFGSEDVEENFGTVSSDNTISDTYYTPNVVPGIYNIVVIDEDENELTVQFSVTASTTASITPTIAPNLYNVTISGDNFGDALAADVAGGDTELVFVIYNSTDDVTMSVNTWNASAADFTTWTNTDGNFSGHWHIPANAILSNGDYTINITGWQGLVMQINFTIAEARVDATPRKASYARGDTIAFDISNDFDLPGSWIEIYAPDGTIYWSTEVFTGVWVLVDDLYTVPYYSQVANGNPMELGADDPIGTWWYYFNETGGDELMNGTFEVTASEAAQVDAQLEELGADIAALADDIAGITDDVEDDIAALSDEIAGVASDLAGLSDDIVSDLASDIASATDAAAAAVDAVGDLADSMTDLSDAVGDIADTANDASDAAQSAADAANDAVSAAEEASSAASGLTTLVYGAIGASLIAALAAIVSLMQISRRIAG